MPNRPITAIRKSKPPSSSLVAEGHAQRAGHLVEADGAERKAQAHRGQHLEGRALAHADEAREGQEEHGEELRRPELQRELGDQRRQEGDQDDGDQGADERGGEGCSQRLVGAALLGHRMAVEGRRHRPRLARNIEQDGGDGAAEQRAPVDAREHDDGRGRRHREGQRQQDRDAVGAAETRQHADDHAEQDADQHQAEIERGQRDRKPLHERGDLFQASLLPAPPALMLVRGWHQLQQPHHQAWCLSCPIPKRPFERSATRSSTEQMFHRLQSKHGVAYHIPNIDPQTTPACPINDP